VFSVASLRRRIVLEKHLDTSPFPASTIWVPAAPSKVSCLLWRIFLNKIATIDNLQKRGFRLANKCVMCNSNLESVDHLFLHCEYFSSVWALLSSSLSLHGPLPSAVSAFIIGWKGMNSAQSFSRVMIILLHATYWHIWKERNSRIFKDSSRPPPVVYRLICFDIGDWLSADGSFSPSDAIHWRRAIFDNG
ncbi:hypothetical protein LINPERHAP1_LOCUS1881, partial [Linum perenne]